MSEFDCIIQIETVKNVQTIKGGERMLLEERLDEIVKIVNGRVYHTNRECTHIRLSVRVVEATEALREYRPCEKCTDKIPHPTGGLLFYVSENGECYHSRRDCPGLKRTVQKIPKEEAFKYEVCSRCRGSNSKDR